MAVVVFLLGRPGSGKSQIARCIKGDDLLAAYDREERCLPEGWAIEHVTDYRFLREMFQREEEARRQGSLLEKEQFCVADRELGGFSVVDFAVLDTALENVNRYVVGKIDDPRTLIVVEFARRGYSEAFERFSHEILRNACFLYLDAPFETCIQRVHERARHKIFQDDSFVTDEIMEDYYKEDDLSRLLKTFGRDRLKLIKTHGDLAGVWTQIKALVQEWCLRGEIIETPGFCPAR